MTQTWKRNLKFCVVFAGLLLLLNIYSTAQSDDSIISGNPVNLYGGKPMVENEFTVGGRKLKVIQPLYGGKRIDERALYNPHLEEAFNYMDKPLFSPNPYSMPRLIEPRIYNPQNMIRDTYTPSVPSYIPWMEYPLPVQEKCSSYIPKKPEEKTSVSPIIPALVSAINNLYRSNEEFSDTRRLTLDGWYGNIRGTAGKSGSFSFHNTQGESVSGTYYVSGSRINFNINHYEKGKSNYWWGNSSQWGTGSSLNIRSNSVSLTGSSSSFGNTNRYQFNAPDKNYEVEIRDTSKSSQSIRVKDNNDIQYGYIN